MTDFNVPETFINSTVQVSFAIPIPTQQGVTFPSVVGTLKESIPGALVLLIGTEEHVIPKASVHVLKRVSDIAPVRPLDLGNLRGKP